LVLQLGEHGALSIQRSLGALRVGADSELQRRESFGEGFGSAIQCLHRRQTCQRKGIGVIARLTRLPGSNQPRIGNQAAFTEKLRAAPAGKTRGAAGGSWIEEVSARITQRSVPKACCVFLIDDRIGQRVKSPR
jgi:hypothetical protein